MSAACQGESVSGHPTVAVGAASPLGRITVVASAAGVCEVLLPGMSSTRPGEAIVDFETRSEAVDVCRRAVAELDEYFCGTRTRFDVEVDLHGTEFQLAAWAALCAIPFGETATYGEQARMMRRDGASRAVGAANGKNPVPIIVPCHRVVGADGSLVGYAARTLGDAGLAMKSWLLDHERSVLGRSTIVHDARASSRGTVGA